MRELPARSPDNFDLRIFATSLVIQHDTGGNLVEVLDSIAHTIRERFKFQGKLRAITTETRLSGYVLGALFPSVDGSLLPGGSKGLGTYLIVTAAFVAVHWRFFAHRDAAMPVAAEAAAPGPTRQAER